MPKKPSVKIYAKDIIDALSIKHEKDVFVSECKIGSSWYLHNCQRLDAWVMNKSWSNPLVTGYEVKVSRGDFNQDNKWRGYLDYCNEFYFVCPVGLIKPDEISKEAGLRYVYANSKKIMTKKKAPYRDVQIPEEIFRYVLMCRIKVRGEYINRKEDEKKYWKDWLKTKEINKSFGWQLGNTLRKTIEKKIIDAEAHNKDLEKKIKNLENAVRILESLGIDTDGYFQWHLEEKIKDKLKQIETGLPDNLEHYVKNTISNLEGILEVFNLKKE